MSKMHIPTLPELLTRARNIPVNFRCEVDDWLLALANALICKECGGAGTRPGKSCSQCGDSTWDHLCDDEPERPCVTCGPVRAAVRAWRDGA